MRKWCLGLLLAALVAAAQADDVKKVDASPVYQVPFRLTEVKHILVRARINGKEVPAGGQDVRHAARGCADIGASSRLRPRRGRAPFLLRRIRAPSSGAWRALGRCRARAHVRLVREPSRR